jgi:AsmA protein
MPVRRTVLVLISVLAMAIMAVAAVGALPLLLPTDFAIRQLQQAVKAATGRTLTVSGAPRIVLWPELSIEADDVVLSNPPGLYHGQVAAIARLRIKIDARSLLARRLDVKQLTLINPRLTLVSDGEGRANWAFGSAPSTGAAGAGAHQQLLSSISAAPIRIENGVVRFVDERTGAAISLTGADLMANFATPEAPFTARGYVVVNRQRVALTLFVKDPARIPGQGSPIDVTLDSPFLKFAFSGRAVLNREASLSGTAEITTPSLRELSAWSGFRLGTGRGLGSLAASGSFDLTNGVLSLSKAIMALDGMNAQGNIKVDLTGDRPKVTAALGLDRIDLNVYGGDSTLKNGSQSDDDDDWSDRPLDFLPLRTLEAKLSLAASELRIGSLRTGRTTIAAELAGGVLDLAIKDAELYGGRASGRLVLNGSRQVPAVQGAIRTENIEGASLFDNWIGLEALTGTTSMTLSLAGAGRTQREVISTLRGNAEIRIVNGALRDMNLLRMLRDVKKDILAGWQPAEDSRTVFRDLSATFALEDGIAVSRDLQLVAPELTVSGTGQADLLRKALDFKVVPKLAAGPSPDAAQAETVALAVPLVVKGPWGSPKIYPDIAGILENPRAGYETLNKLRAPTPPLENDGSIFDAARREKVKATLSNRSKGSFGTKGDGSLGDDDSLLKGFLDEAATPGPDVGGSKRRE